MKTCTKCGETKDLDGFYRPPKNRPNRPPTKPTARRQPCKECHKADRKRRYRVNLEEERRLARERQRTPKYRAKRPAVMMNPAEKSPANPHEYR